MRLLRAVDPWAWPPLLMTAIFVLSAQPDLSTGLGLADLIARKLAHAVIYAALCVSWWRVALALGISRGRAVALAAALSAAYAVSDEWHQGFVPGRSPSALDVAIDAVGVGLGAVAGLATTAGGGRRRYARDPRA